MNSLKRGIGGAMVGTPVAVGPAVTASFRFRSDFIGFAGHFPDYPILPAMAQVIAAVSVAESHAGGALRLTKVDNAKFMMQIRPDQEIEVTCRKKEKGPDLQYEVRISSLGGTASAFTLGFATGMGSE